ncbi:MAG: hypothetical protein ACM3MJ_07240 [Deltaproteobacteria bacterium]
MRRSIVILAVCDLVLVVLAVFVIVVSPTLRLAGVAGLGVAAILTVALALAAQRRPPTARPDAASTTERPSVADLEEATSLRNQPTWRDDVEGRTGPKW